MNDEIRMIMQELAETRKDIHRQFKKLIDELDERIKKLEQKA